MRSHPKIFRKFLLLTSDDEKIPTDRELDNDIETLSWYMHCAYPLVRKVILKKLKIFFLYRWKTILRKLVIASAFFYLIYFTYSLYIRPTVQNIVISEKIQSIEHDILQNPIPKENVEYMIALSMLESGSSYKSSNGQYWGMYQLGDLARKEVGLSSMTKEQFLSNQSIQHWAFNEYLKKNYKYLAPVISKYHIPRTGGIRVGMHLVTVSGILAAAHLVGQRNVKVFLESNGRVIPRDGNGKPLTDYLQLNNMNLKLDN